MENCMEALRSPAVRTVCPKKRLDTISPADFFRRIPDLGDIAGEEKSPKMLEKRAGKLVIYIKCFPKKVFQIAEIRWDREFLTFSTEFSTEWVSR